MKFETAVSPESHYNLLTHKEEAGFIHDYIKRMMSYHCLAYSLQFATAKCFHMGSESLISPHDC